MTAAATADLRAFTKNLKRIHKANDLPVDRKLADSIIDDSRDTCADCEATDKTLTFTIEDALGNERTVCADCRRKAQP